MKLHRFFISPDMELKHNFWLHDERLLHQWCNVLRFKKDQQVVLFDGFERERLYKIEQLNDKEAHLVLITEMVRSLPKKDVYLAWSLLKKDKNDWVLQKCTELGVSHFLPLLADRSEKTGFNIERAQKIVIEASEQCGRSDIPNIREPIRVETVLDELQEKVQLYVCEQSQETDDERPVTQDVVGILIGPEGGWSDAEKELFKNNKLEHLNLHDFTLRAETAAVAASTKLLQ